MQIPGSPLPQTYPLRPEPLLDRAVPSRLPVPVPSVPTPAQAPLTRRAATPAESAAQLTLSQRSPLSRETDLQSRRALDAYESVQEAQRREELHLLFGFDGYA